MQSIRSAPRTWFKIIWFFWACNMTLCEPSSQQQWAQRLWSHPEVCEKIFIRRHWRAVWIQSELWKNLWLYRSDLAIFCCGWAPFWYRFLKIFTFTKCFKKLPYLDSRSFLVDKSMFLWIMQDNLLEYRNLMYGFQAFSLLTHLGVNYLSHQAILLLMFVRAKKSESSPIFHPSYW